MRMRPLIFFILSAVAGMSADAPPLFSGVLTIGKEKRVVLTSQSSGTSSGWITIGSAFDGYRITDYDSKTESVGLERDGRKLRAYIVADASPITSAGSGTPAAMADADRLLQAMNFEASLKKWVLQAFRSNDAAYFKTVDAKLADAGVAPDRIAVFHKLALEEVQTIASGPDVLAAAREAYKSAYSKEELQGLAEFFSSPVGKLYVDKGPEINQAISAVLAPRMQSTHSHLDKLLSEFLRQEAVTAPPSK